MSVKLKPLGDRIVIKQAEAEETTKGGILLPEASKEKPCMGKVVAVGPGLLHVSGKWEPMDIRVGQTVLYSRYGGSDITLDGEQYTVMHLCDLIGIIE